MFISHPVSGSSSQQPHGTKIRKKGVRILVSVILGTMLLEGRTGAEEKGIFSQDVHTVYILMHTRSNNMWGRHRLCWENRVNAGKVPTVPAPV